MRFYEFFLIFPQVVEEFEGSGHSHISLIPWGHKRQAILTANAPISKTLRPCREESVDFDNTENLYTEGDNLEVLKLLQETYLGKVKMIYIDIKTTHIDTVLCRNIA